MPISFDLDDSDGLDEEEIPQEALEQILDPEVEPSSSDSLQAGSKQHILQIRRNIEDWNERKRIRDEVDYLS